MALDVIRGESSLMNKSNEVKLNGRNIILRCVRASKFMRNKGKSYVSKQHEVSEEWRRLWVFDAITLQNGIWIDGIPLKQKNAF